MLQVYNPSYLGNGWVDPYNHGNLLPKATPPQKKNKALLLRETKKATDCFVGMQFSSWIAVSYPKLHSGINDHRSLSGK